MGKDLVERPDTRVQPDRWTVVRDAAVFQLKLFLDGIRDLVMMPISLGAAALDVLGVGTGHLFYDLLRFGRKTEGWINLFGEADRPEAITSPSGPGVDALVTRMERLVVSEYERGGITASAKDAVDRALDQLTTRRKLD